MKKLLIFTLFALTISVNAQYTERKKIPESIKIITLFAGSIILDAISDGMIADNKNVVLAHSLDAASFGLLLASPLILDIDKKKWLPYLASYVSFRIALFDPVYNTTRGLPIEYVGDVSVWDKGLQLFNPPKHGQIAGRALVFTFAITFTISEFK